MVQQRVVPAACRPALPMPRRRPSGSPTWGVPGLLAVLAGLDTLVGLSPAAWVTGLACGGLGNALLARGLARHGRTLLGPADLVTLTRATLACGVAAIVADGLTQPASVGRHLAVLTVVSTVALVLDWVDGRVARRTGTVTPLGARYDMEVDAFLILVLSVEAARSSGAWVLAIGLARYALLAAEQLLPWLRRSVPPRYWRKVVAAVQGVVLTVVASGVLARRPAEIVLLGALLLLTESFGRDVVWLAARADRVLPAREDEVAVANERAGRAPRTSEVAA